MSFGALLETALAGSLRREVPAGFPAFDHLDAEDRLLRSASYEGMRRLAGRPLDPVEGVIALEPCGPDVLPAISALAGARLLDILSGRPELLLEWLTLATERQVRASPDCLPELLEAARTRPQVYDLVIQVGGQRLAWLAALNPEWRFATAVDPLEGRPIERAHALLRIRRRDPARGRQLLQEIFNRRSERAEIRSALLDALEPDLSAEDEPLLQQAVQDPRRELREKGLRLIRRIPNSHFGQRWSERARTLVRFGQDQSIEIREPEPDLDLDKTWIDDGLDPRPPKGIGRTAWILQQTLALTPPSIWPWCLPATVQRSDWSQPLLTGLAQAAAAYADADWCEELIAAWANAGTARDPKGMDSLNAGALLGALAPDRAEAVFRRLTEIHPDGVAPLLGSLRHTWSDDFSRFVVAAVPGLTTQRDVALRLDPRVLPEIERLLEGGTAPAWNRHYLQRLVKTLQFRLAMREELG